MVYFIQQEDNGPIKIGYTGLDVNSRLTGLQCGSPKKLNIIGLISGDKNTERQLHELFKDHRVCGEWFSPVDAITKYCKKKTLPLKFAFEKEMKGDKKQVIVRALIFEDYFKEIEHIANIRKVSLRYALQIVIKKGIDYYFDDPKR